ncbi:MAG TPA: hypothetical protein VHT73_12450 [Thermodesulfobacteriota bacterium]|nr:hypothetical protein [Thermodesulfobacteriota bacterium]
MQIKKEDKILGVVATSLIERGQGKCPTDEEFALYQEGKLKGDKKKALISHFISCRDCRERFTIPAHPLEAPKKASGDGLLSFLWRPIITAPVAVAFVVVVALTVNVYLSQDAPEEKYEEVYRGANLVALKQVDLTPGLLRVIKEGDEEELKNELVKQLPPGSEVSNIKVEDSLKRLKEAREGEKVNLILYSNGILKVKPE